MVNSEVPLDSLVCICDKLFYVTSLSFSTAGTAYDQGWPIGRNKVSILGTDGLSVSFVCTDKELEDLPSIRRITGRKEREISCPGAYLGATDLLAHVGNMITGGSAIKLFKSSIYGTFKAYDWELVDAHLAGVEEEEEEEKPSQFTTKIFGDEVCATVITYGNSKTVKFSIGISKKSPEDKADLSTGIKLSVERAINASTRKVTAGVPFVEKEIPGLSKYKKEITEFMQQFSGNLNGFQNTYFPENTEVENDNI